jgi:hypothetical protein
MLNLKTENPTMTTPHMQTTRPNHQNSTTPQSLFREDNENFGMGLFFGLIAAIGGACTWAFITALTNYQIGWMAIGVGFVTGWAVRVGGKGTSQNFGIAGACLALFGCLLGNLLSSCFFISQQYATGYFDVLFSLDSATIGDIFAKTFMPIDLLFYGLAIYTGYKYSRVATEPVAAKS